MKPHPILITLLFAFSALITVQAEQPKFLIVDTMRIHGALSAIVAGDYSAFCELGEPELKKSITEEEFRNLSKRLKPGLLKGFWAEGIVMLERTDNEFLLIWQVSVPGVKPALLITAKAKWAHDKYTEFKVSE